MYDFSSQDGSERTGVPLSEGEIFIPDGRIIQLPEGQLTWSNPSGEMLGDLVVLDNQRVVSFARLHAQTDEDILSFAREYGVFGLQPSAPRDSLFGWYTPNPAKPEPNRPNIGKLEPLSDSTEAP